MARNNFLTSPLQSGADVVALQRNLIVNKYGKFYNGKVDGEYGPLMAQAVYRSKYRMGYAAKPNQLRVNEHLLCDQVSGQTHKAYLSGVVELTTEMKARRKERAVPPPPISRAERAFNLARTFIGVKESPPGSNDVKFSRWFGEQKNGNDESWLAAWCFMFVSYCYTKTGTTMLLAYCPDGVTYAKRGWNGWVLTTNPVKGDIVFFNWDNDWDADHVGLFEKWIVKGSTFSTIEGNTSAGNNSNGGQVQHRQDRKKSEVECFARFVGAPK